MAEKVTPKQRESLRLFKHGEWDAITDRRIVRPLESKGLLECVPDSGGDPARDIWRITPSGRRTLEEG